MAVLHEDTLIDLTQLTRRLLVIGSPFLHDSLSALSRYLSVNHGDRYKVYNFTVEKEYNLEQDMDRVVTYPIVRGCPCPLLQLIHICESIEDFLNSDEENVVVLHSSQGRSLDLSCW
jgi:hypothetical protein